MATAKEHLKFSKELYKAIEGHYGADQLTDSFKIRIQFLYADKRESYVEFRDQDKNIFSMVDIVNLDVAKSFKIIQEHTDTFKCDINPDQTNINSNKDTPKINLIK